MNGIGGDLFAIVYDAKPTALRAERQRLGFDRDDPGPARRVAKRRCPRRESLRDRPRRGGRLGRAPRTSADALRNDSPRRSAMRPRDSRSRKWTARMWTQYAPMIAVTRRPYTYLTGGRAPPQAQCSAIRNWRRRCRPSLTTDGRLLSRVEPLPHSWHSPTRRHHDGRRPGRFPARVGDADPDRLSRVDGDELPPNGQGSPR